LITKKTFLNKFGTFERNETKTLLMNKQRSLRTIRSDCVYGLTSLTCGYILY